MPTSMPLHTMLEEAVSVAAFVRRRWKAKRDARGRVVTPGLELLGSNLPATIGDDVLELRNALEAADTAYRVARPMPLDQTAVRRARAVLSSLRATLQYVNRAGDSRTATVQRLDPISKAVTHYALAMTLDLHAERAHRNRALLAGLGTFDVALIEEARTLAAQLRDRLPSRRMGTEALHAQDLRVRIAALLAERVREVRAAAQLVFRDHPKIAREATSGYERQRRAKSRKAKRASKT